MNRHLKLLVFTLFVVIPNCYATIKLAKGDDIPIPLESYEFGEDTTIFRGVPMPIFATYNTTQALITVSFVFSVQNLSVELSNLLTGEDVVIEEFSCVGSIQIPLPESLGVYRIQIRIDERAVYYGYFLLE